MTTNNEVDIPDVDNAEEINEPVSQKPIVETPQELEPESDKTFLEYLLTLIKNNAFVVIFVIVIIAYIFLFSSLGNRNQNMQSSLAGSLTGTMNSIDSTLRKETSVNSGDGSSGKYLLLLTESLRLIDII